MPEWGDLQVDQLRFMARRDGDAIAYRDLDAGTAITFAGWDATSNRLARALVDAGIAPGDRVSIYLPGDEALRWIVAYAAVHKAGAVVVPTNTRLSVPEGPTDPRPAAGAGGVTRPPPAAPTILGHAEVAAVITCRALLDTATAVRDAVPSIGFVVSVGGGDGEQ